MATENPKRSAFNRDLCNRTRALRESKKHPDGTKWTIVDMADLLGVTEEAWRSYETRIPLPHYLIPRLARVTGQSVEYVLTGKDPVKLRIVREDAAD